MRSRLLLLAAPIVVTSSLATSTPATDGKPTLVATPVAKVFVPSGFDDNDNAELVLHGEFPNNCYRLGPSSAKVNAATHQITVEAHSYFYEGSGCTDMKIPFVQPVSLGLVPAGKYSIIVPTSPGSLTEDMRITVATTRSADEYIYAPVEQVALTRSATTGAHEVVIEGHYPMMFIGCMKIVELRTKITDGQVIVMQPIAQLFTADGDCADQAPDRHFRLAKPLTELTANGKYLAHVRSLDGQSINRLFDIQR